MFVVFCHSSKSSYLKVHGCQSSANFLKCYFLRGLQHSFRFPKDPMTWEWLGDITARSPTEPNSAQQNHFCFAAPKFLRLLSLLLIFPFHRKTRPATLSPMVCCQVVTLVWIFIQEYIPGFLYSCHIWHQAQNEEGTGRILFGQEPQHWHILASPLPPHSLKPRGILSSSECCGEKGLPVSMIL